MITDKRHTLSLYRDYLHICLLSLTAHETPGQQGQYLQVITSEELAMLNLLELSN